MHFWLSDEPHNGYRHQQPSQWDWSYALRTFTFEAGKQEGAEHTPLRVWGWWGWLWRRCGHWFSPPWGLLFKKSMSHLHREMWIEGKPPAAIHFLIGGDEHRVCGIGKCGKVPACCPDKHLPLPYPFVGRCQVKFCLRWPTFYSWVFDGTWILMFPQHFLILYFSCPDSIPSLAETLSHRPMGKTAFKQGKQEWNQNKQG